MYVLGVFAGVLIFDEMFPLVKGLYSATPMGQITISQWSNIPYGMLVFAVVLMAIGGFIAAEWAERKNAGKEGSVLNKISED
jgi:hypothetical protein